MFFVKPAEVNKHAPGEVGLPVGLGLDMDQDAAVFSFDFNFRQDINVVFVANIKRLPAPYTE
ncbi:hypothetical protein [Neomoorella thermoacetica]|uniref:hypothetical protein n=1 Tax=Neomoorella thermoacetica TaxID=1525 RepID=UPI001E655BA3|nr:hypothetical protein [Moorella thermoacetica]